MLEQANIGFLVDWLVGTDGDWPLRPLLTPRYRGMLVDHSTDLSCTVTHPLRTILTEEDD